MLLFSHSLLAFFESRYSLLGSTLFPLLFVLLCLCADWSLTSDISLNNSKNRKALLKLYTLVLKYAWFFFSVWVYTPCIMIDDTLWSSKLSMQIGIRLWYNPQWSGSVHHSPVVTLTIVNSTYKEFSWARLLKTPSGKVVILLFSRNLRRDHKNMHSPYYV